MTTVLRVTIAIVVSSGAVLLFSGVAAAAPSPVRTDSSADIDAWVEQRMTARGLPGTAVAVVRGGDVVHLAGYGVADDTGRAVTPDTPFIIGSASKPFTAVVIGQLVDEGLLSWDEPVWPHLSHLVDDAPDGFQNVTVEQLLTHTAGLSMIFGTAGTVTTHEGPDALDRRADELLSRRLSGAPGEEFNYSNAGFMLLAAVTEQVTGRSFADELADRVFDPLGMTGSYATADDPRAADTATGHQQWFGRWRPVELPYDNAGTAMGYIASTASDLATFISFIAAGHAGQYDLSVGLATLLLDEQPVPADRPVLLSLIVPATAWAVLALLVVGSLRSGVDLARRRRPNPHRSQTALRTWAPGIAAMLAAAATLVMPLSTARHFYPDAAWGATLAAAAAFVWGLLRLARAAVRPRDG